MQRRTALGWMCSAPLLGAAPAWAQATDLNDAIDKAGRQRMLSQRAAKAYMALGQGIAVQRAQEVLNVSMSTFDRQLVELKVFAPSRDIKATYTELDGVWSEFKAVLVGQAPKRELVPTLLDLDEKALALAHKGTVQLEQLSAKKSGALVNLSGRQRMLSQRAAKFYLAMTWKAKAPQAQAELNKARTEFNTAMNTLVNAPETNASIRQELELARAQWVFFEGALAKDRPEAEHISNVLVSSENVLLVMEKTTSLYARLKA